MLTGGVFWKGVKPFMPRIYGNLVRGILTKTVRIATIRSIHNKNRSSLNDQVYLYGKSPNEVEQSLAKLNLSQLPVGSQSNSQFICIYLKKLNVMNFRRTLTHLNRFQSELKKQPVENDVELYNRMVSYLLEESDMEVKRLLQFGSDHLIQTRLESLQEQEDPNLTQLNDQQPTEDVEKFVMDNILPIDNNINEEYPYLAHLQSLFNILNELRINPQIKWDQYISVDQLVVIFEMSKLISDPEWKDKGLFLSGSILYSTKQIRMDPVNESFYINSLMKFGHYKTAFQLFKTNKDNIKQKWWMELGLMLSLVNNNLRTFQKLLHELNDTHPNVTLSPKILKLAIKKYSKITSLNKIKLNQLLDKFINNIEIYGIKTPQKEIPDKIINFNNEEEANLFLNEVEQISYNDIVSVTNSLLYNKQIDLVGPFLDKLLSLKNIDQNLWEILIVKTKLNLLKDFESIKALLPKSFQYYSNPGKYNLYKFRKAFNEITCKYIKQNNPLINMLLFDTLNDLVSNYKVPIVIEKILSSLFSSNTDKLQISKYFDVLLNSFLSAGETAKAEELLSLMERMKTDSQFSLQNKDKYPSIDIKHYTAMVKYYTNQAILRHSLKVWKLTEQKIIAITNKVNSLNLPYSSSFITRLIMFYRENKDFNRCFLIINKTLKQTDHLEEKIASELDQTATPLIRQKLYFEIWKVYFQFYKFTSLELVTTGVQKNTKNWTSSYYIFKKGSLVKPSVDLITLFNTMTQRDNVLPDQAFCKLIILTFMKSRNWASIPSIITYFTEIFNIELDRQFVSTILTGVRKEYIANETQRFLKTDHALTFNEAKIQAKEESNILEKENEILLLSSNNDMIKFLLKNILLLTKYKNPFDTDFTEVKRTYQTLNLMDHYPEELIASCK